MKESGDESLKALEWKRVELLVVIHVFCSTLGFLCASLRRLPLHFLPSSPPILGALWSIAGSGALLLRVHI